MSPFSVPIVYKHNDFIVINKPAGIGVHREGNAPGIIELVQAQHRFNKLWLVHRLDKVTSGLLILALNSHAAAQLSALFSEKAIQKYYFALSDKKPKKKQGSIVGDMEKSRNGLFKLTHSKQNPAITQFFSKGVSGLRLFVLKPATGKTHQLRVAMKSLGSPILGDTAYTGSPSDRAYLHAYALSFVYQNESMTISTMPQTGEHFLDQAQTALYSEYLTPNTLPWPQKGSTQKP
ncbi:TIGR01621 family pseudouridine synthase [Alteromonas sp. a30]|uniref:TIGR01621 family pseudouridine synthase n=1 Tax=Alteromonas sp. a30 TaxID=2730917 RepID=UPI002280E080|nr:TIGR01621 family pseudouridine synthase [Alteromonas sp. a30]MCY7296585.1 TIGR01621 family pseudouridine synthase [Alteromonas sp. a30]